MDGCAIAQDTIGWWNLLVVVLVALIPLAVMAGWQWGRMAQHDNPAVDPVDRWQWSYELHDGGYLVVSRLSDVVPRARRWEVEHTRPLRGRLGTPSVHYYRYRWGARLHLHRAGGGTLVQEVTRARS